MKESKDYYLPVVFSQIAVCFIVVLIIFFINKNENGLKADFSKMIEQNFDSVEIMNAFESIKDNMFSSDKISVSSELKPDDSTILSGMGGTDLDFYEAGKNTSFAPIFATTRICPPIEEGRYSSLFGYRINPISGDFSFHTGLDIACPEGTDIKAAFSGTVTKSGDDVQAGKYIYITHDNGFVTFYCHCSAVLVEAGTVIRQGETIALVGSTGYATGPHLHFEVRKDGIRYNPLWLLEK